MVNRTLVLRLFIKLIVVGVVAYVTLSYISASFNSSDNSQDAESSLPFPMDTKLILFGSRWWHPHYPFLEEAKAMCPNCRFTEDSSLFETSDAVVFHSMTTPDKPPIKRRGQNQIWIWLNFETTDYVGTAVKKTAQYTDMFNWTMTYRADSDVQVPYGRFVSFAKIPLPKYEETWAFLPSALPDKNGIYDDSFMKIPTVDDIKGRKMAAWIVSHCKTESKRELVAKELSKYIEVDIYGNCGNFKCDVPREKGMSGIDCRFQISHQYKFYLAFENSLCEDYVTEKYFDVLYTQMIPIVYGNVNYSHIAPKNSYIDVQDFSNVEELAKHLKFLDQNPEEYLKYFEWRKNYWVQNNRFVTGYCDLCEKLWTYDETTPKYYHNLTEWWYHRSDFVQSGERACVKPKSAYLPKPTTKMPKTRKQK